MSVRRPCHYSRLAPRARADTPHRCSSRPPQSRLPMGAALRTKVLVHSNAAPQVALWERSHQ
eukprot:12404045-Alexandrium_andersonii.AAC.1